MENFPTLSGTWETKGLSDSWAINPVKQAPFSAGYQQRSKRATFVPQQFVRSIRVMTAADIVLIEDFLTAINDGGDMFVWTDPLSETAYQVFISMSSLPLRFEPDGVNTLFRTTVVFEQANSSETIDGDYGYGLYGAGLYGE